MAEQKYTKGAYHHNESFKQQKIEAVKAAKDLYYGKDVIRAIENATTTGEISRIMINARHEKFRD